MFFTSNENVGKARSVSYTPETGISAHEDDSLIMSFSFDQPAQSSVAEGTAQKTVSSACGTPASKGWGCPARGQLPTPARRILTKTRPLRCAVPNAAAVVIVAPAADATELFEPVEGREMAGLEIFRIRKAAHSVRRLQRVDRRRDRHLPRRQIGPSPRTLALSASRRRTASSG